MTPTQTVPCAGKTIATIIGVVPHSAGWLPQEEIMARRGHHRNHEELGYPKFRSAKSHKLTNADQFPVPGALGPAMGEKNAAKTDPCQTKSKSRGTSYWQDTSAKLQDRIYWVTLKDLDDSGIKGMPDTHQWDISNNHSNPVTTTLHSTATERPDSGIGIDRNSPSHKRDCFNNDDLHLVDLEYAGERYQRKNSGQHRVEKYGDILEKKCERLTTSKSITEEKQKSVRNFSAKDWLQLKKQLLATDKDKKKYRDPSEKFIQEMKRYRTMLSLSMPGRIGVLYLL